MLGGQQQLGKTTGRQGFSRLSSGKGGAIMIPLQWTLAPFPLPLPHILACTVLPGLRW